MTPSDPSTGIYVHVPFCLSKCSYCDFYSIPELGQMESYLKAVGRELEISGTCFPSADTLYFGGGTPSLLPSRFFDQFIASVTGRWAMPSDAEITLELNPATLTSDQWQPLKTAGINRINIGIQSFNQGNLSLLGRIHTPDQAIGAVECARRTGFTNLGIDLIFGLPDQTPAQWKKDLDQAIALAPEHLSCYILSYEFGTPLYRALEAGRFQSLEDGLTADLFRLTHQFLTASGYEHYEISNFAKPGYRSRHNQKYWKSVDYLGLGPAAHSYLHPLRWWNHRSLGRYLSDLDKGLHPIAGREKLTPEQQMIERIYLGLRQSDGLRMKDLHRILKGQFLVKIARHLEQLQTRRLAVLDGERFYLTVDGMLQLDHISSELIALID